MEKMDWFRWLSQTELHPYLVYKYGVIFSCNELTLNDVAHFDHDFLISLGVNVGKHRLEILKLARAETHFKRLSFKGLFNLSRRGFVRYAKKLVSGSGQKKEAEILSFGRKLTLLKEEWKEIKEDKKYEMNEKVGLEKSRSLKSPGLMAETGEKTAKSGPTGKKKKNDLGPRKFMSGPINEGKPLKDRSRRFSGPLDERPKLCKSQRLTGQTDGCDSPWAILFGDLRPN